jgi:exopolyphosphatase/guanosine-5'-triphosphate,3'-diphosphate pyrophosphatase
VTRVAVVDLGTNSTRLLVADVEDGIVREVVRRTAVTRLGEGVDERRRLLPVPVARVRNVLTDFRRELEGLGAERTLATATSAVRDAENGEAFLGEVAWSYGFATRLLSGDEEAALTLRGIRAGLELPPGALVLDVGGGSTELSTPGFRISLEVGSVRLTERFLHDDPPASAQLAAAAGHVEQRLPELDVDDAIGVAGTVHQLATLAERDRIPVEEVDRWFDTLAALPVRERRALPRMNPDRAPMIVAGILIVRTTLHRYRLGGIAYSVHDLLDGAALEAAALRPPHEGGAPPGAITCC